MNKAIKALITTMLNKRIIGGKHAPEEYLLKTRWLRKEEIKEFEKEYRQLINNQSILKIKKKTGKGSDWHISLNPRNLKELYELIRDE